MKKSNGDHQSGLSDLVLHAGILERISDAFIALDKKDCFTYVNRKAGEIFQRNPDEMKGLNIWKEFPRGVGHAFQQACEKAMREQQYVYLEDYYISYDKWFESHI